MEENCDYEKKFKTGELIKNELELINFYDEKQVLDLIYKSQFGFKCNIIKDNFGKELYSTKREVLNKLDIDDTFKNTMVRSSIKHGDHIYYFGCLDPNSINEDTSEIEAAGILNNLGCYKFDLRTNQFTPVDIRVNLMNHVPLYFKDRLFLFGTLDLFTDDMKALLNLDIQGHSLKAINLITNRTEDYKTEHIDKILDKFYTPCINKTGASLLIYNWLDDLTWCRCKCKKTPLDKYTPLLEPLSTNITNPAHNNLIYQIPTEYVLTIPNVPEDYDFEVCVLEISDQKGTITIQIDRDDMEEL
jgi:hypothetical protein